MEEPKLVPLILAEKVLDGCIERCGNCGTPIDFPYWKYCPKCGAKFI